jgi:hypothetical protein
MKAPPKQSVTMLFVLLTLPLLAQKNEIVSSAGDSFATEAGHLSFTLGEIAIETLPARPHQLTQGFHQPMLWVQRTAPTENANDQIRVFPNPVGSRLYIQSRHPDAAWQYTVLDLRGIKVREGIVKDLTEISFDDLPASTYTLQVKTSAAKQQSFKIVKQ